MVGVGVDGLSRQIADLHVFGEPTGDRIGPFFVRRHVQSREQEEVKEAHRTSRLGGEADTSSKGLGQQKRK